MSYVGCCNRPLAVASTDVKCPGSDLVRNPSHDQGEGRAGDGGNAEPDARKQGGAGVDACGMAGEHQSEEPRRSRQGDGGHQHRQLAWREPRARSFDDAPRPEEAL